MVFYVIFNVCHVCRFNKQWMMEGEQSKNETDWKLAHVDLVEAFDYQIIFRGMVGKTFYSDIAIDDIAIKPLPCGESKFISV